MILHMFKRKYVNCRFQIDIFDNEKRYQTAITESRHATVEDEKKYSTCMKFK